MGFTLGTGLAVAAGGTYLIDTILDFIRQTGTGAGELELAKLALAGQRQDVASRAAGARKEERRMDKLMQEAMRLRRKERYEDNMLQFLGMLERVNAQKQNALLNFATGITARPAGPPLGRMMGGF